MNKLCFLLALSFTFIACTDYDQMLVDEYGYLDEVKSSGSFPYSSVYTGSNQQMSSSLTPSSSSISFEEQFASWGGFYFEDSRDGRSYKAVKIGDQVWMAENLNYNYEKFNYDFTIAKSACYDNLQTNCDKYGRLYTASAAASSCPDGWHLPNLNEFKILQSYVDEYISVHSIDLPPNGTCHSLYSLVLNTADWVDNEHEEGYHVCAGDNLIGFSLLPAGMLYRDGEFWGIGSRSVLWGRNSVFDYADGAKSDENYDAMDYQSVRCLQGKSSSETVEIRQSSFTDMRDCHNYKIVAIGEQVWMAENLDYNYNINTAVSYPYAAFTSNTTINAFIANVSKSYETSKLGRFYTWSAAMDSAGVFSTSSDGCGWGKTCSIGLSPRGVCPEGWHIPSKMEWETFHRYAKNKVLVSSDGGLIAELRKSLTIAGDGVLGFSLTPGILSVNDQLGSYARGSSVDGWTLYSDDYAIYWTSSDGDSYYSFSYGFGPGNAGDTADDFGIVGYNKDSYAFAVRCIYDKGFLNSADLFKNGVDSSCSASK